MALALSAHTPWVQLVSHVSACWLTGLVGTWQERLAGIINLIIGRSVNKHSTKAYTANSNGRHQRMLRPK